MIKKTWEVYERETGKLLVSGTTEECRAVVNLSKTTFYQAARSDRHYLRIVDVTEDIPVQKNRSKDLMDAFAAWDAFCEPLRKEFGIPVYRPKKETKNKK